MAISKELKKDLDREVKKLINSFKKEFIEVKERDKFNDRRIITFLNIKKCKREPFYFGVEEEDVFHKPKSIRELFICLYKQDKIIIYINYPEIYSGRFFHATLKVFLKSLPFYRNVFKQIAHHEYGHSFITKTNFDAYPKNVRTFLQEIECDDIYEAPDDKIKDLKEVFRRSKYGIVDESLKNIELMLVEKSLREFHADFSVLRKIESRVPIESLKMRIYEFDQGLQDKVKWKEKFFSSKDFGIKELSNYFFFLLILTQKFYIFNVWHYLKDIFEKFELNKLLDLFHLINKILKKIIKKNKDFNDMRLDILELAQILDNLNYEKIFFEDIIIEKDILLLKDFINNFKA